MVGGSAGVAAQQLASVFTHPAELHVVIVLFLRTGGNPKADLRYHSILAVLLKILKFLILCFPLDSLFFLRDKSSKGLVSTSSSGQLTVSNYYWFVFLSTHTVRAAPLALRGLLQLWLQADKVVRPRTGVAQDDFPPLLTHLAVVLMIRLVAVTFLITRDWRPNMEECLKLACK